jgi:hypothetical protein
MIYQDIVMSPEIFSRISKAFSPETDEDLDFKSYKKELELKKIVLDKKSKTGKSEIYDEICRIINTSSDFSKQKLDSILKQFLVSGRNEYKEIDSGTKYTADKKYNTIINLSLKTESKLVNCDNNCIKLLQNKFEELKDIDVLSLEEMTNPPSKSSIFNYHRTINLKKDDHINLVKLLRFYLLNSVSFEIHDKYLRKRDSGLKKLKEILVEFPNLKTIKIFTNFYDENQLGENYVTKEEMTKELSAIVNQKIEIHQISRDEHDRHIYTDKWDIFFSAGLDFLNNYNCVYRKEVKITIEPLSND